MKIELQEVTVSDLSAGYAEQPAEGAVVGYGGKLDVRPAYQREFVYKDKQRDAVIDTLTKDFPLNVMYWSVREDGTFEVIDGQQRTIAICRYVEGDFAFKGRYFHNLQADEKQQILDYKLSVYLCTGTDSEKLDWFETINIAGEELSKQELRNAVYHGPWVSDAKRWFSRSNAPAIGLASDYLSGAANRQAYLETAIKWINDGDIEDYMAKNQLKPNANELWLYFQAVIAWVTSTFPHKRQPMKSVPWGLLYNVHKDEALDPVALEERVAELMADDDVSAKPGIYSYVLNGNDKVLSIRRFSPNMRTEAYERQQGICPMCGEHFKIGDMESDHITPWHLGGKTNAANCQMLCKADNRTKGGK